MDNLMADLHHWLPSVLDGIRAAIEVRGFATASITGCTLYTLGLTIQGLPELVLLDVPGPAVTMLDEFARAVLAGKAVIDVPQWEWYDPGTGTHTLTITPYTEPIGLARALFGDYRAVVVDLLSCPCELCADRVVVDCDGQYVRDA